MGGTDKSGIVRRETSTTLLNEAKASGTAEFPLLLNEYDVAYNAINQSPECLASIPTGTSPR